MRCSPTAARSHHHVRSMKIEFFLCNLHRFGEILIRMTLRVPSPEMLHVLLARGVGAIRLRVLGGGAAEESLILAASVELEGMLHRVSALVPHDLHAFGVRSAFGFEQLLALELHEARMAQVERDGEPRDLRRREPFVGDPEVRVQADFARVLMKSRCRRLSCQAVDWIS